MEQVNLEAADALLWRWGDCVRGGRSGGLGYPSCSAEQMANTGSAGNRLPPEWPIEVRLCEEVVARLPVQWREIALRIYPQAKTQAHCASDLRISVALVRQRLGEIKAGVACALVVARNRC